MERDNLIHSWRALPQEAAPPFDYAGLLARQDERRERWQRQRRLAFGGGGAAVLLLLVAGIFRFVGTDPSQGIESQFHAASQGAADDGAGFRSNGLSVEPGRSLQPALVDADSYLAVSALEDRVAWFDDALSEARVAALQPGAQGNGVRVRELEFERARLAESLVQVRYAAAISAEM
jgi:hypothetical protein